MWYKYTTALSLQLKMIKMLQPFCQLWQPKTGGWLPAWNPFLEATFGPWNI